MYILAVIGYLKLPPGTLLVAAIASHADVLRLVTRSSHA